MQTCLLTDLTCKCSVYQAFLDIGDDVFQIFQEQLTKTHLGKSNLYIIFKIMKFKFNVFKLYLFKNSWCHRCLIYRNQLCVVLVHLISSIEQHHK